MSKINTFKRLCFNNKFDILTNLDYEHFYLDFIDKKADLSVVSIPYKVNIPYAVFETENRSIRVSKKNHYIHIIRGDTCEKGFKLFLKILF